MSKDLTITDDVRGPETIGTDRLVLRRPLGADAEAIFSRYAGDPGVTKFLAWQMHRSIEDTKAFLALSEAEWEKWPVGPYLIKDRGERRLIGGTGLGFKSPTVAETGYVFARDAWGFGYATEALGAIVIVAREVGVRRLSAFCHPDHLKSARVLEKCGFARDDMRTRIIEFPNLGQEQPVKCLVYGRELSGGPK